MTGVHWITHQWVIMVDLQLEECVEYPQPDIIIGGMDK